MADLNLVAGWAGILAGLLAGAGIGLFFHDEAFAGGYGSWRRRMLRLGHVALVGTGLLNLAFGVSGPALGGAEKFWAAPGLFVAGAVAMPAVCFLSAWRKPLRNLFFLPVLILLAAVGEVLWQGVAR